MASDLKSYRVFNFAKNKLQEYWGNMKKMDRLFWTAIILTELIMLSFECLLIGKIDQVLKLDINEWGDAMAGFAGTVAVVWLVIGFYQNAEALRLQQKELHAQIDETRRTTEAAERHIRTAVELDEGKTRREIEKAKPKLSFTLRYDHGKSLQFAYKNYGGEAKVDCVNVIDCSGGEFKVSMDPTDHLVKDGEGMVLITRDMKEVKEDRVDFEINYADALGIEGVLRYRYCNRKCTPIL